MTSIEVATEPATVPATPHLRITLFGRADVNLDGAPLELVGGPKVLALLAFLAVEGDRPHRREELTRLLWPDTRDVIARTNLRVALFRLRRVLPAWCLKVTRDQVAFATAGGGTWLDVADFLSLAAACRVHAHVRPNACAECAARLDQAVTLFRGEFLSDAVPADSAPFEEWLLVQREALAGQFREALAALAAYHQHAGDYSAACQIARKQLRIDAWNEPAHRQLMRGLALGGNRAAALAQYESCRQILADELGTEPEAETRALAEHIRNNAVAEMRSDARAPTANLPTQLTPFVGRERELAVLSADLQRTDRRLITLVGAGGIGKTRLAVEAARACLDAYADGAFFVSLASLLSISAIAPAIASAIGQELYSGDPTQTILRFLRDKRLLLILDNFEHLLTPEPGLDERGGAGMVLDLLQQAPSVQLLVTSRERLNVRGEYAAPVFGLDCAANEEDSSAVRLFVQAARRALPGFELDPVGLTYVQRICQLVQGAPLALELAAGWTGTLPLREITAEIERSLDFLVADWRDAPERQRSLRAVFDWSWRLLDNDERQILCRLSIFRGGFTRTAAEVIVGASLHGLANLMRKSMVGWAQTGDSSGRYEVHEMVRQFAARHLDDGDRADLEARHGAFYLDLVTDRERDLLGLQARDAVVELRRELDNIRQAWTWAITRLDIDRIAASASALRRLYYVLGLLAEGERAFAVAAERLRTALAMAERAHSVRERHVHVTSQVVSLHAALLAYQGKFEEALPLAKTAVALAEPIGAVDGSMAAFLVSGEVFYRQGHYAEAQQHLERALELARSRNCEYGAVPEGLWSDAEWRACIWLGLTALAKDEYTAAAHWIDQSLDLCGQPGHAGGVSALLFVPAALARARLARRRGDYDMARADGEEALRVAGVLGHAWSQGASLLRQGEIARLQGAHAEALDLTKRALALAREIGDRHYEADALVSLAHLAALVGEADEARAWLGQARELLDAVGTREVELDALLIEARLDCAVGDGEAGAATAERAWHIARDTASRWWQAQALTVKGQALSSLQQSDAAAASYERAIGLASEIGIALLMVEPRAGLASLALARGELSQALAQVELVMQVLAEQPRAGLADPSTVYLTCYRVLDANRDERAEGVLSAGQLLLAEDASHISLGAQQRAFAGVADHRALRLAGLDEPFGDALRRLRLAAGLTQEALAEQAGLSARGISDLERGARQKPHPDTLRRLGEALGLAPAAHGRFAPPAKAGGQRDPVAATASHQTGLLNE